MNFVVAAALAVGLLVALPLVAHFLRRGRAQDQPFAAASLVKAAQTSARRERKLEDRGLFSLRALAIVALAVLGATPLVRCSRLSLARGGGGTLSVAIVLDDSLSMRATTAGASRWERAREAALKLLDSAHEGDSVALVLAGAPARIALAPTTDLAAARRVLRDAQPSDRSTDLAGALAVARASFGDSAPEKRRLVVLSDFAAPPLPPGDPPPWTPLPDLAVRLPDCGIASAETRGTNVTVVVACNTAEAARGRSLELVSENAAKPSALEARAGVQTITLPAGRGAAGQSARLTGSDSLAADDSAPVAPDARAVGVAVLADETESGTVTGGPPLLEQVVTALDREIQLTPLTVVPDQAADLEHVALLLLDDPAGLSPEARSALGAFADRGGTAVALLGPRAEVRRLGATLEPFASGPVRWEREPAARGADPSSLGWLGAEAASLAELAPHGRAWLAPDRTASTRVTARWSDGAPLIVERSVGRGLIVTVTLPSSVTRSDFALRPGFVALVDTWVDSARERRGLSESVAGATWSFGGDRPRIVGPAGPLPVEDSQDRGRVATPVLHGTYRITLGSREETRTVTIDPQEITADPVGPSAANAAGPPGARRELTDVSREVGWLLVALLGLELAWRVLRLDAGIRFR